MAALLAYGALGWPTVANGEVVELVTGTVLGALEVPRVAWMLAACWWRCSGGTADMIRGLPALPDPRQALAVIACGDRSGGGLQCKPGALPASSYAKATTAMRCITPRMLERLV
jgi:hypothetical protein